MSWKGTLLLLLLAGLSLGYLFFSGRSRTHPPQEPLLAIDPASATEISIQEGTSVIQLSKTNANGEWMVHSGTSASPDRADPELVNSLLQTASDIVPLDILRAGDLKGNVSLSSLGLKKPNRSITIRAGRKETLWIGAEGAAPASLYARLDSGKTVYLISSKISSLAFHPVQEYRDSHLTELSLDHLQEITLSTPSQGIAPRELRITRSSRGMGWQLQAPIAAEADKQAVDAWLASLLGTKILHWMPAETDSSTCGLDTPAPVLTLKEEGAAASVVITFGGVLPDGSGRSVRVSSRPGIGVLPNSITNLLSITPGELRSKKLTQVEFDTIDQIAVDGLFLDRKPGSEDWIVKDQGGAAQSTLSGEQVKAWYDRLQGISATGFEAATPEHLASRNLLPEHHPLSIRLIARLSENTAQENAGESVLAQYTFGAETNAQVAVREGTSPELLILPASSVEFLKTFPSQPAK